MKKTKKKTNEKRNMRIILCIVVIAAIIFLFPIKMYSYRASAFSGTYMYKIRINKITKKLHGTFYETCNYVDCEPKTYKYSIKLTKDEYKKIMKLWNDKESLSPILESLCEDTRVLFRSYEKYKEFFDGNEAEYNAMDSNSDGKITSREYANQWLNDALNERKKK